MSRWWPFRRRQQQRAITFQDIWGSGADDLLHGIGQERALRLAPVYAATRLLSDSVASLPLLYYRDSPQGRSPAPTPTLFRKPSVLGTRYDWVHRCMTSLTLRGNAYGLVVAVGPDGWPSQIEWLHPDDVTLLDNLAPTPTWYYKGRRLEDGELFHIAAYTVPGQILGLSPIAYFATTTDTALLAEKFGKDWFQNGSTPAAVLETDQEVGQTQGNIIKDRFKEAAADRGVAVLGQGAKYRQISVAANESQFLETIKASANQIAAFYGVPAEKVGGTTGNPLTYTTVEQNSIDLLTWTLRPWLARLEEAFSLLRPPTEECAFNADAMLRTDTLTRYQTHRIARAIGLNNIDELRRTENQPPLPTGQGQDYTPLGTVARDESEPK